MFLPSEVFFKYLFLIKMLVLLIIILIMIIFLIELVGMNILRYFSKYVKKSKYSMYPTKINYNTKVIRKLLTEHA